jgi:hypothetical protein
LVQNLRHHIRAADINLHRDARIFRPNVFHAHSFVVNLNAGSAAGKLQRMGPAVPVSCWYKI